MSGPDDAVRALMLEVLGREPTADEVRDWTLRGLTDHIADNVADGIEAEPHASRYTGGDTYARVLDFGEVPGADGLSLRITVELVRGAPDDG